TPNGRARLDLPAGPAPPQGSLLRVVVEIHEAPPEENGFDEAGSLVRPRLEENGCDEAGYLRRQGVDVILKAGSFTIVGRRGGLGGIADRVRAEIACSLEAGAGGGERGEHGAGGLPAV